MMSLCCCWRRKGDGMRLVFIVDLWNSCSAPGRERRVEGRTKEVDPESGALAWRGCQAGLALSLRGNVFIRRVTAYESRNSLRSLS
ncbi:hypothetical protein SKAU_G00345100 [Synaphobranchus kaupii]|uniref:Uncharacterized protein n=1 Tax=Synaphobranchus kaupii TaxID=118154 RepID=A0A9Q1EJE1_SYNKA|nr:hypothetical protein SKAU_G00345100 [Synaphobranchus kaupii]